MNISGVEEGRMLFNGTSDKTHEDIGLDWILDIGLLLDFSKNTCFPSQLVCITSVTSLIHILLSNISLSSYLQFSNKRYEK